jgi:hypothetical protein
VTLRRRLLLVLLALLVPGLASAQGLGDAAAREKQKRKATASQPKARVLSNDDLRKDEPGKPGSEGESAAPESPQGGSSDFTGTEAPAENEEAAARRTQLEQAQAEVDSARSAVVAAEGRVKELGDKLNPMSATFIYGASGSNDANEELRVRAALQQAEAELTQSRDALVRANRGLEDVRQGRPAGSSEPR